MMRRNKPKKKKFLPYKNLGSLYTESVFGLPSVLRTTVLGEGPTLDIYAKDPETEETDKIGTVNKDYFVKKVKPAIRLGSVDSASEREEVEKRLKDANGLIGNNLDIFQSFINDTGIIVNKETTEAFKDGLLLTITDNQRFTFADLIHGSFKGDKEIILARLPEIIGAFPVAPRFGRPGEGELALGFFAGGKKPSKGDVQVGSFLIEAKGPGARLYGTETIGDIYTASLAEIVNAPANEQVDKICNFIIKYSGNTPTLNTLRTELTTTVTNNFNAYMQDVNTLYNVNKDRDVAKANNSLLIFKTMGWLHLMGYQKSFGFDGMLFFNKSSPSFPMRGLYTRDLNLDSLLTIKDIVIRFIKDGNGFSVNYVGV